MALFRSKAPATKPAPTPGRPPVAAPVKVETPAPVAKKPPAKGDGKAPAAAGGGGFLNELGIYTLPNELKAPFRKIREEVQRYLVD